MEKLAPIILRPAVNRVLYHGALSPRACWRPEGVAYRRAERTGALDPREAGISIRRMDSNACVEAPV